MARSHVAGKGGIAELRSKLPEIIAELPALSLEGAMRVAEATAKGATERASTQYEGSFNIEAKRVSGQGGEVRSGVQQEGKWISGWTLGLGSGPHVIKGEAAGVYADWFWFFGEFGTSHQPARPFMIPAYQDAFANELPQAEAVFKKKLEAFGV